MIAFMQVFEDIAKAVLLPAMNVAVGATIIGALAVIVMYSTQSKSSSRHKELFCSRRHHDYGHFSHRVNDANPVAEGNKPQQRMKRKMPETGKALERPGPKVKVSNDPKNDVWCRRLIRRHPACFDDQRIDGVITISQ